MPKLKKQLSNVRDSESEDTAEQTAQAKRKRLTQPCSSAIAYKDDPVAENVRQIEQENEQESSDDSEEVDQTADSDTEEQNLAYKEKDLRKVLFVID